MENLSNARIFGEILKKKNKRIAELEAEIAALRGILTEEQKQQDEEDQEVFRFLREKPRMSEGCLRIVIEV